MALVGRGFVRATFEMMINIGSGWPLRRHWPAARPWLGLAARLTLAGVWLVAGGLKAGDLADSARAVAAYRLVSGDAARAVGAALPFVELALGVLLLLGLATRLSAAVSAALFAAFAVGIGSAWARGLSIDCGCFGGGGQLAEGQYPNYAPHIAGDVALLLVALFLTVWPGTRLAADGWIAGPQPVDEEVS